jgi:hypothetical protein
LPTLFSNLAALHAAGVPITWKNLYSENSLPLAARAPLVGVPLQPRHTSLKPNPSLPRCKAIFCAARLDRVPRPRNPSMAQGSPRAGAHRLPRRGIH